METHNIIYDTCRDYITDNKSALPLEVYTLLSGWIRSRRYDLLAGCSSTVDMQIASLQTARTLYQVEAFFSKNANFTNALTSRLAALISFEDAELHCDEVNKRVSHFYNRDQSIDHSIFKQVTLMQRYIDKVLGPFGSFIGLLPTLVKVTPGATATLSRKNALPFLKVSKKMHCTPGAAPYLKLLAQYFGYKKLGVKLGRKNRVEFVPKSWKTMRTIACEATGNMPLQLAFDRFTKRRLRRVGINLSDQTRNQELAKIGSANGTLATIDIKQASDTVSYDVVNLLFPQEWFRYLQSVRSEAFELYPGIVTDYAKFSSMGNGSTFCIETLIFAAACSSVGSRAFSVYGDDIIIETDLVNDLMKLLAYLGFTINTDKSFFSGPIRESCGTTWYLGQDITPKYFRGLDGRKPILCHHVNNMLAISDQRSLIAARALSLVTEHRLPLVPFCEDSMCGVWVNSDAAYSLGLISTTKPKRKYRSDEANRKSRLIPWTADSGTAPPPMILVDQYVPYVRRFKGYVPKSLETVICIDSRALFLWHLQAQGAEVGEKLSSFLFKHKLGEAMSYTSLTQKKLTALINRFLSPHEMDIINVGRYTVSDHTYDRKWIHWYPVVSGAPDHLDWWSEDILSYNLGLIPQDSIV